MTNARKGADLGRDPRFRADIAQVVHTHLNDEATLLVVEWWTPTHGLRRMERECDAGLRQVGADEQDGPGSGRRVGAMVPEWLVTAWASSRDAQVPRVGQLARLGSTQAQKAAGHIALEPPSTIARRAKGYECDDP
jgi:hypothetical protein